MIIIELGGEPMKILFLRKEKPVSLLAHSGQYISRPPHRRGSKGKEILLRTPPTPGS